MGFTEKIKGLVAEALKAGDKRRTATLRLLLNSLKNREIELRRPLDENEAQKVIRTMVRQRKDSIEQYEKAGREELANAEKEEIKILEEFLPAGLTKEEIEKIVSESAAELNATTMKDMGRLMKTVMAKTRGRADGKTVQEIVKKTLNPSTGSG